MSVQQLSFGCERALRNSNEQRAAQRRPFLRRPVTSVDRRALVENRLNLCIVEFQRPESQTRVGAEDRIRYPHMGWGHGIHARFRVRRDGMTEPLHPAATQHLPSFITAPGETDWLMVIMAVILALAVLMFGILFFRLHSLPERMAHRSQKLQFEIVAVLCLISLFTHMHIFWIAGLLLALIDLPDFGTPLGRIAGSVEKIAGIEPGEDAPSVGIKQAEEAAQLPPETHGVRQGDGVTTLPTTVRQAKRS